MEAAALGPLWDPCRNETIKCLRTEDRFLNVWKLRCVHRRVLSALLDLLIQRLFSPFSSYWCRVIKQRGAGGDVLVVLLGNQLVKITLQVLGKANGEGWLVEGKVAWWRRGWRGGFAVRKGYKDFFSKRAGGLPAPVWNPATITLLACSAVPLFFFIQATYHNRQGTWGHQKRSLSEPHCVLSAQPPCLHPAIDSQLLTGAREKPEASWEQQVHLWHSLWLTKLWQIE